MFTASVEGIRRVMVGAQDATTFSVLFRKLILAYLLALSTTADINDITLYSQYVCISLFCYL